ncbi:phosphopantothenate--cysteine ligase [Enterococcus sp. LJL99]
MNILITAGGTIEKIDDVRSISNHSTGKLGKEIAESFLENGHQVTYVCSKQAVKPKSNEHLSLLTIETTRDLEITLLEQFQNYSFDAIIHSMAVSDFTTEIAITEDKLIEQLVQKISAEPQSTVTDLANLIRQQLTDLTNHAQQSKKIPSNTDRLLLFLKKNPKIIAMIREKQPTALLVGFKLLVGVSEQELIQVGTAILEKNNCDFVLANDLEQINAEQHKGFLISKNGKITTAQTKKEIARLLLKSIEKQLGGQ